MLKTKWGSALLPAPTVAAAGTLGFQRLSSPRPSAVPCPLDPILSAWVPPVRFPRPVSPASGFLRAGSAFSPAASAVPDHMGLAVTGSVAAVRAFPPSLPLRACFLVPSRAPLPPAWPRSLAAGRDPRGDKGPDAFPFCFLQHHLLLRMDRGLCCIRFASGRQFGIRNRFLWSAFHRSQSAPQHAEMVSMRTFEVGSIRNNFPVTQRLAAPFSKFSSLSTSLMLRLGGESRKRDSAELSTAGPVAGGQLCKLRNRLRIIRAGCFCGRRNHSPASARQHAAKPAYPLPERGEGLIGQRSLCASSLSRSALSLMKPAASFWS